MVCPFENQYSRAIFDAMRCGFLHLLLNVLRIDNRSLLDAVLNVLQDRLVFHRQLLYRLLYRVQPVVHLEQRL